MILTPLQEAAFFAKHLADQSEKEASQHWQEGKSVRNIIRIAHRRNNKYSPFEMQLRGMKQ